MSTESYQTVRCGGSASITEKKSEFICSVSPAANREEALDFINAVRKKYPDAKHNVYAYITRSGNATGYSDDKEPQGTAGLPILNVLKKRGLFDVAVVVTRYFGGILLGTGGLTRAYSGAAAAALDTVGVKTMRSCKMIEVYCNYQDYRKLSPEIVKSGKITGTNFGEKILISAVVPDDNYEALLVRISELTGGKCSGCLIGESFFEAE